MFVLLGGSQDPEPTEDQEPGCRRQNQTRDSELEAVPPSAHHQAVSGHQHPHRHFHGHGVRRRFVQILRFINHFFGDLIICCYIQSLVFDFDTSLFIVETLDPKCPNIHNTD